MNVLPSAPTYDGTQTQQPQALYPTHELAQLSAEDVRLKKINDLPKELSDEAEHYRQVAKKYRRTHSIVHRSAVGLGSLSVGLSSGALATALTGFGIMASPALAGVATLCGLSSVGFNIAAIVLFYTPSSKTTKAIFEDYAGELSHDEYKELIARLKRHKFSHLVFALRHPYGLEYHG